MDRSSALGLVVIVAGVTALLRFLPFLVFSQDRKQPRSLLLLSRSLPPAVIGMLVVYCLRGLPSGPTAQILAQLGSVAAVALCHVLLRNVLLSVIVGTVCYMLLTRLIL